MQSAWWRQKLQAAGRKTIAPDHRRRDNGSIANIAKAVEAAQEADAVVYGIHYEDDERPFYSGRNGMSALEKLSGPTGGRTFHVSEKKPLGEIFSEIGEEMRNQYGLGFTPPADGKDGEFHKLEVKSTKVGLKARRPHGILLGTEVAKRAGAEALPFPTKTEQAYLPACSLMTLKAAIDVMADVAALAEFRIGLGGHVGHVGPGSVARRAGGGGGRSRIHQEVRSLDRVEANREDGFGAGEWHISQLVVSPGRPVRLNAG